MPSVSLPTACLPPASIPVPVPPQDAAIPAAWTALDEPAEWPTFGRPLAQGDTWESFLAIEGMYCPGCTLVIEEAIGRCGGVRSVEVNGVTGTARVVWSPSASRPSLWLGALRRAGYSGMPAADLLAAVPRRQAQRLLLWRWLVAGFCMMQVMMYATPAYVAAPGEITPDIESLLRWASWLLTLPVLLFSCRPFFHSAWRDVRHARIGMDVPVSLGIVIAFAASTAATFDPQGPLGGEVWFDSIAMFVFFLLSGRLLELRLRDRTAGSIEALVRRLPDTVLRRAGDGSFGRVAIRSLQVGDIVRVLPGEAIPADGTVRAGSSQVDEALLTGESRPLERGVGQAVVAGSHNLSGVLELEVERLGTQTRFAQIVALIERASVEKPALARLADRIAGPFLACVLVAAAASAVWWWSAGASHALGVAIAVLIVTCPCALSLATPAANLAAAGALARRGVLVRRLQAFEACAQIDTVVFDKTGTLTDAGMTVVATHVRAGIDAAQALQSAAALASHSLHPVARAIGSCADANVNANANANSDSKPYTAQNVREVAGRGVEGDVAGEGGAAPRRLRLGSATFCGIEPAWPAAGSQVHLSDESGWVASFELDEALRPSARSAVDTLRRMGLDVQLLSGDQPAPVRRLAARAGIASSWALRSPQDKLDHVRGLQRAGHRVAMIGDGMNDGPVLARADLSVAMGQAVPLAQAQADFIITGSQLGLVATLLTHARRTRTVIRQNLAWAAAYNLLSIPLAVAGWMPPWLAGLGMALSSLLVVLNSARLARLTQER